MAVRSVWIIMGDFVINVPVFSPAPFPTLSHTHVSDLLIEQHQPKFLNHLLGI